MHNAALYYISYNENISYLGLLSHSPEALLCVDEALVSLKGSVQRANLSSRFQLNHLLKEVGIRNSLRTFTLIVHAHPYCARNPCRKVLPRVRAGEES